MIITCGQCQAKFKVAPEQIKVTGSKVRCSSCQYVFTVYRPGRPGESSAARPPGQAEARPGSGRDFEDDLFEDEAAPAPAGGYEDGFPDDEGPPVDARSARERRDQRRRLYGDLDERPGRADREAEEDDLFDDGDWAEAGGRPPLRRGRPPAGEVPADGADLDGEDLGDEAPAETDPEDDDLDDEAPAPAGDALGLTADPAHPSAPGPRVVGGGDLPTAFSARYGEVPEARPAVTKIKGRRSGLFLALAIFCAALAIGLYFLSARPEPLALSDGSDQAPAEAQPTGPAAVSADPNGTEYITFTQKDNLKHFYRNNAKEGQILIITGMVRNNYPEPRSFIRLRGTLLDQGGTILADRFVYAGNTVSEDDLLNLPISEILARLNIKGGQNNRNMKIPPGQEVPFMVVFDKLPPARDEYRIIPVGSSPAD
jgi:predicted Zn finger-like uncharacterized protein